MCSSDLHAISSETGAYSFSNVPFGHTTVEVSHIGYAGIEFHLDLQSDSLIDFAMSPSIIENQAVTITAGAATVSPSRAAVQAIRLSRQDIIASGGSNIIDAIARQPGISQVTTGPAISKPQIRGLGYNRVVVVNDGMRQEGQQ